MSAPRMKRLSKMSLRASADRKKFEGVEKPLRTFFHGLEISFFPDTFCILLAL